jgi:type I protein arginine methyltransferase
VSSDASPIPEEMLLGQFIPLHYHFNMLRDQSRMLPFREAIERTVPAGGRVLELGGGTGVLSWFAAQRASKVWCVERNPALVRAARSFLANNPGGERVEVVHADAMSYLPPEPVDVVICEMLHVALIREKQLEVLQSFKDRYIRAFGPRLPTFIPDATVMGIQLLQQEFSFCDYVAPVPLFEPPGPHETGRPLAEAQIYSTLSYETEFSTEFDWESQFLIQQPGMLNAMGFLTNNFLAFVLDEARGIQWPMNQLVLPLAQPLQVATGDAISVRLNYRAGCPLEELQESLIVEWHRQAVPFRRVA